MPCPYYNKQKESLGNGIYCDRIGGRPGVKYWSCYCDHRYSDCPHMGGDDPYGLDPATLERRKREEDKAKAETVIQKIRYISSRVTVNDAYAIESARSAYESLTRDQKGYVSNYHYLTEAERALQRARTEKEAADRAAKDAKQQKRNDEFKQRDTFSADRYKEEYRKTRNRSIRKYRMEP